MTKKIPITPPVLQKKWRAAVERLNRLGKAQRTKMIHTFRLNRSKCIATWGISNFDAKVEGLEPVGLDWYDAIAKFENIRHELHRYRYGNGAEDYISQRVMRAVSRKLAKRPRPNARCADPVELAAYLRTKGYYQSLDKAAIRNEALNKFGITTATFYRLLKRTR